MNHSGEEDPHLGDAAGHQNAGGRKAGGDLAAGNVSGGELEAAAGRSGPLKSASRPASSDRRSLDAGLSDLTSFFPRHEAGGAAGPARGRFAPLLEFGSNAALVVCVLGFAFAAGTYFFSNTPGPGPGSPVAAPDSERAEMARTTQKLVAEIGALKSNVEALRVSLAQQQAAAGQHGFEKSVDLLKTRLDAARAETSGQLAELSGKVDRLQHDPALQQVAERLDRIEKQTASMLPTGSVAPLVKAATQDRATAGVVKSQPPGVETPKRPALITNWVVRDVYNGVALVENARGSIEVALGDTIPGAGTVKAIERRGDGWIVITSRGLIDYDQSIMVP
jgi:hypothetical protein